MDYEPLGQLGDGAKIALVPLAKVLTRLDEQFEEPLDRAALLPGYAEYEAALTDLDGWPVTGEPLMLLKVRRPEGGEHWAVVSGLHVLTAAKKLCKARVPCSFIRKSQIPTWLRANAEGGLRAPRASADEDEEMMVRRHYAD